MLPLNITGPQSSFHQPLYSSVQLFGNIRRCRALLTGVRHIAGQTERAIKLRDITYFLFYLKSRESSALGVSFIIICQSSDKGRKLESEPVR